MTKKLSNNAIAAYKKLYLSEVFNEQTPTDVHHRVAKFAASAEKDPQIQKQIQTIFFEMMENNEFRPNSPTLMNAGTSEAPQTSACFVGNLLDDMEAIIDFDRESAIIYKQGSGIGGNYGLLRETNATLSTGGKSSGPFAFLRKAAMTAHAVKSGGSSRRAAHMAMMTDTHPDLLKFITIKADSDEFVILPSGEKTPLFSAMNLSVAASNAFMEAIEHDEKWDLIGVKDGKVKDTLSATWLFEQIVEAAWTNGDPGIWFIDSANRDNTVPSLGRIQSTNPCVTGDTLVAVADGRQPIPIKQLAEEGIDVPVHCVDPKTKKALIRMGRNPRMTRRNMSILKVTLDDGSVIRTTEDHKFLDFDGQTIKANELKPGQRLMSFIWRKTVRESIPAYESIRTKFGALPAFKDELVALMEPNNHRVISVESDGVEDVYNLTVDEVHTVAYVTNTEATTRIRKNIKHWGLYTRQCGEQALLARQACGLGAINVAAFVDEHGYFDWGGFQLAVTRAARFLDNCIDISGFPTPEYRQIAFSTRPIGLGIMGFADALILMGIKYNSSKAVNFARELANNLTITAIKTSIDLAKEKGPFPLWDESDENKNAIANVIKRLGIDDTYFDRFEVYGIRNSQWTTIAPTGTTSIACDCSQGMEPLFAICYDKIISDSDEVWTFVNPIFEKQFSKESWYPQVIKDISENHGSVYGLPGPALPKEVQTFVCAHDIDWQDRIDIQAALQKGISNSISSTINLPHDATPTAIRNIYMAAWKKGLKGITVFRDGCLKSQPVQFGKKTEESEQKIPVASINPPKIRTGYTHELNTGHGKVYFTVNCNEKGQPMEIFTNGGKNGSVNAANLEAMARLVSIALQEGVDPLRLAITIENINDGTVAWDKLSEEDERAMAICSIPDAMGKLLKRFYCKKDSPPENDENNTPAQAHMVRRCEKCNSPTYMMEGCEFCPNCGSKCG